MELSTHETLYNLPLDRARREIRLLSINNTKDEGGLIFCTMTTASLDAPPPYHALSYTWGDPKVTKPIFVDQIIVNVTVQLETALQRLRQLEGLKFIWIDALCINQGDLDEKNYQVPLMGEIYSSATNVYVWLGESDETTSLFFNSLAELPETVSERPSDNDLRNLIKAHILATNTVVRPYWRRVWIVQELILSREDPLLLCGSYSINFLPFLDGIVSIVDSRKHIDPDSEVWKSVVREYRDLSCTRYFEQEGAVVSLDLSTAFRTILSFGYLHIMVHDQLNQLKITDVLPLTTSRLATDPRDKIYGLLGLLPKEGRESIKVNYSTAPIEVFQATIAQIWESAYGLDTIFELDYSPSHPCVAHVPSWVADLCHQEPEFADKLPRSIQTWSLGSVARLSNDGRFILNHGTVFDATKLAIPLDYSFDPRGVRSYIFERYDSDDPLDHPLLRFFRTMHSSALRANMEELPRQHRLFGLQNLKRIEQPWQTLILGGLPTGVSTEEFSRIWTEVLSRGESNVGQPRRSTSDEDWKNLVAQAFYEFCRECEVTARGRCFITTSSGFVGIAPLETKEDDIIVLLHAANLPMILRPHEGGYYTMVGAAYVSGIMDFDVLKQYHEEGILRDEVIRIG
jgi:hypothetical protein